MPISEPRGQKLRIPQKFDVALCLLFDTGLRGFKDIPVKKRFRAEIFSNPLPGCGFGGPGGGFSNDRNSGKANAATTTKKPPPGPPKPPGKLVRV